MQVTHRMAVSSSEIVNEFLYSVLEDGRILLTIDTPDPRGGLRDRKSIFLTKDALSVLSSSSNFFLENSDNYKLPTPEAMLL